LSPDMLLSLVMRVSFLPSMSSRGSESEPEKTHFNFTTKGSGTIKVEKIGLPAGKFQSIWDFTLPSGENVHFEIEEFERFKPVDGDDIFVALQPITNLLEDCIINDVEISKRVPLTNRFTDEFLSACLTYHHCDKVTFGF